MKLVKTFDSCLNCKFSFSYEIMLTDDAGLLRIFGLPKDQCPKCKKCTNCCKCPS